MKLRPAQQSDVPDMATILLECNKTDVIGRFRYKNIEKYPTSYRLGHWLFLRSVVLAPGTVAMVVETEPSDYTGERAGEAHRTPEVVGYAWYIRMGDSEKAKEYQRRNTGWLASLNRGLMWIETQYYQTWFPSTLPVWNTSNNAKLLPLMRVPWDPEVFVEAFDLDLLMVHPKWQRRGVGKMLLNWGFETAQKEKVPIVLKSSPVGGRTYRATGFKSFGKLGLAQVLNELEFGGEPSQKWVWEPKLDEDDVVQGKWHERALANVEKVKQALEATGSK